MKRTGTRIAFLTLLVAWLVVAPAGAQDKDKSSDVQTIEVLKQAVAELQRRVTALEGQVKDARPAAPDTRLEDLRKDLNDLRQQLSRIESAVKPTGQERVARAFTPGTGIISLENTSGVAATVVINGKSYRVEPGENVPLRDLPAGEFFYEVRADGFGTIQSQVLRTLKPNEKFTITVYPR